MWAIPGIEPPKGSLEKRYASHSHGQNGETHHFELHACPSCRLSKLGYAQCLHFIYHPLFFEAECFATAAAYTFPLGSCAESVSDPHFWNPSLQAARPVTDEGDHCFAPTGVRMAQFHTFAPQNSLTGRKMEGWGWRET